MKNYFTSINLSILSLGLAVFHYLLSFTPPYFNLPIESLWYIMYVSMVIESLVALAALIMGIKEKNKTHIILAGLLLVTFLKPLLSSFVAQMWYKFL